MTSLCLEFNLKKLRNLKIKIYKSRFIFQKTQNYLKYEILLDYT